MIVIHEWINPQATGLLELNEALTPARGYWDGPLGGPATHVESSGAVKTRGPRFNRNQPYV